MKKIEWLDRGLLRGPYYCLCLDIGQFHSALKHLNIPKPWPEFLLAPHANATVHLFEKSGNQCHVVCLGDTSERTGIEVAGLLLHEGIHIWQNFKRHIGESAPGDEIEAYSIQWIAQQLMWAFEKQIKSTSA